jgi:hypothetical protein
MEQRTILEIILGVYKLDKKYRSVPENQQMYQKSCKSKCSKLYTKFTPIGPDGFHISDSFSNDSSEDSLFHADIESNIDLDSLIGDVEDYSDSDDYAGPVISHPIMNKLKDMPLLNNKNSHYNH